MVLLLLRLNFMLIFYIIQMGIMNMLLESILGLMKLLLLDGMSKDGLLKILLGLFGEIMDFLKLNLKIILGLEKLLLLVVDLFVLKFGYLLFYLLLFFS